MKQHGVQCAGHRLVCDLCHAQAGAAAHHDHLQRRLAGIVRLVCVCAAAHEGGYNVFATLPRRGCQQRVQRCLTYSTAQHNVWCSGQAIAQRMCAAQRRWLWHVRRGKYAAISSLDGPMALPRAMCSMLWYAACTQYAWERHRLSNTVQHSGAWLCPGSGAAQRMRIKRAAKCIDGAPL